jgi:uncharacterized protein (TIGR01777 family)
MKIAIAGASGLIGGALCPALEAAGHSVLRLVRRENAGAGEIAWDPAAGLIDTPQLEGVDAVINLAGENVGAGRWTEARREAILRSRVDATRTLVAALTRLKRKPAVLLNASAVGYYGDRGEARLDESAALGTGFLPGVCLAWETHARGAERLGIRTVLMRFGVVLARHGGALAKMLPLFRLGLGGKLGSGAQWMSWVALGDVVGAVEHALRTPSVAGPVNVVAPDPVTNAEFTRALARALGRPAVLPAPAFALRAAMGRGMADEALLASTRALPAALLRSGYSFQQPALEPALRAALR